MKLKSLILAIAFAIGASTAVVADGTKKIVAFYPGSSEPWVNAFITTMKDEAKRRNYDLDVIENGLFQQSKQDEQVQQLLALGKLPDLFLWWPAETEAGVASLRALSKTGVPVMLSQTQILPSLDPYIVGSALDNDEWSGVGAAKLAVEARDELVKNGHKLHSAGGNVVALTYPTSFGHTAPYLAAFKRDIEAAGMKLIGVSSLGFTAATAYTGGQQLISKYGAEGIDIVFGFNGPITAGGVSAFTEAGYKPHQDIEFVGGVCNGDGKILTDGVEYGTTVISGILAAQQEMAMVDYFFKNGKLPERSNFQTIDEVTYLDVKTKMIPDHNGKQRSVAELCNW
jgi:ribose transport system substrate-binding protein